MTVVYLKNAKNLQELKSLYFQLAKKLHPDHGGSLEEMKILNAEYDFLKGILHNKKSEKNGDNSRQEYKETVFSMSEFKDMLDELLSYPNIVVEIIGSWLWVSGKGTYNIKEILKEKYHFRWSKKTKKWYWFSGIEKSQRRCGGHLKKAIQTYGIERYESDGLKEIPSAGMA